MPGPVVRMPWAVLAASLVLPLAACATVPPKEEETAVSLCPPTRNWVAWVNAMPGPDAVPALIVEGEVQLPVGKQAALVAGATDRMSPPGQRFTLALTPGNNAGGWQKVRGELRPSLTTYNSVIIGCEGEAIARIEDVTTAY